MYVFLSDINTKLQLFYFTAKYFMLKFFFNFASSACSFFFVFYYLYLSSLPPFTGGPGWVFFLLPHEGNFSPP